MSHEDFTAELNALREKLPVVAEEAPTDKYYPVYYSEDVVKRICDLACEGKGLRAIARENGMPSLQTLINWKKNNPEFAKKLRDVREIRAMLFEEAAIEAAEACDDPKDVPVARLKVDTYWKAAEVNDPKTYGRKVEHAGSVDSKVQFNVITGFGPPNRWQTPPKLRPDGTIDKSYEDATEVSSEVVSGAGNADGNPKVEPTGNQEGAGSPGPADTPSSGVSSEPGGVPTLPSEPGHSPANGSPESP